MRTTAEQTTVVVIVRVDRVRVFSGNSTGVSARLRRTSWSSPRSHQKKKRMFLHVLGYVTHTQKHTHTHTQTDGVFLCPPGNPQDRRIPRVYGPAACGRRATVSFRKKNDRTVPADPSELQNDIFSFLRLEKNAIYA